MHFHLECGTIAEADFRTVYAADGESPLPFAFVDERHALAGERWVDLTKQEVSAIREPAEVEKPMANLWHWTRMSSRYVLRESPSYVHVLDVETKTLMLVHVDPNYPAFFPDAHDPRHLYVTMQTKKGTNATDNLLHRDLYELKLP